MELVLLLNIEIPEIKRKDELNNRRLNKTMNQSCKYWIEIVMRSKYQYSLTSRRDPIINSQSAIMLYQEMVEALFKFFILSTGYLIKVDIHAL